MKSIKFIFAILFVTSMFISCTSDSAEDEELYAKDFEQNKTIKSYFYLDINFFK